MTVRKARHLTVSFLAALFFLHALFLGETNAQRLGRGAQKVVEDNQTPYVAAILMEPKTGQILFEQEIHKPWPPASLTKMMLMLIVIEKVKQGAIKLTDPVLVSARASKMGGSQVYLKQGESFPLEDMMKAIAVHSANDASEAVAEKLAGDADAFVVMMNQRAQELGLKDTKYFNAHGLPPERSQQPDVTSAYDTALLARELVKYPEILKWTSIVKEGFRDGKFVLENTNHLIGKFPGADGLKTGSYHEAGFNLAATAERDGMRLISVTLGSPTNKIRFREGARLLTMGFSEYKILTVMKPGEVVPQAIRIKGGQIKSLQAVVGSPAQILVKRADEKAIKSNIQLSSPVWAPLKKGDKLGELTLTLGDKPVGKFTLISNQDIQQSNIIWRLWDRMF
ncbi:MAG TPA: D-alanyl-D-alanine carboxypeptidase family protein [Candidatus Binatia bacterium]|jgi:D-alanyl-D-alanine carboxypeptidase (penicillin-binding protein 5/6)